MDFPVPAHSLQSAARSYSSPSCTSWSYGLSTQPALTCNTLPVHDFCCWRSRWPSSCKHVMCRYCMGTRPDFCSQAVVAWRSLTSRGACTMRYAGYRAQRNESYRQPGRTYTETPFQSQFHQDHPDVGWSDANGSAFLHLPGHAFLACVPHVHKLRYTIAASYHLLRYADYCYTA